MNLALQLFQELWLLSEKYKIGFQPLGSTFVFSAEYGILNSEDKRNIFKAATKIKEEFSVDLSQLSLGLRVGCFAGCYARSPRKKLEEIFKFKTE